MAFLHMCKLRVIDLNSATPLSVHIFVVLGKSFPFLSKGMTSPLILGKTQTQRRRPMLDVYTLDSYWMPNCRLFLGPWVDKFMLKRLPLSALSHNFYEGKD